MSSKYLTETQIVQITGDIIFDQSFTPMSQDTYNEKEVIQSIVATNHKEELAMAAVNMACIGYGNKKYGQFRYKDHVIEIATLLSKCNFKLNLTKDSKLQEKDLTPQRLCRAFRHKIRKYLEETNLETYLYRKYAPKQPEMSIICFRGSEYLEDLTQEQVVFLLRTYENLDSARNTQIKERMVRVFQAKGLLPRTVNT
jgi:hypothetical protein